MPRNEIESMTPSPHSDPNPAPAAETAAPAKSASADDSFTLPHLPSSSQSLTVPQIPGYEIIDELGRGGMGVVYKAGHLKLNRIVALKMVLAGGHASQADLQRFLGEAEAFAALQHPNIVQIFEISQHDGLPFFTLEFVPGGTLVERIHGRALAPQEAASLVEQLARGMSFAHAKGLVHRDLKPGNVLLAADGTPKITDFGLVTQVGADGRLTRSGAIMGTPSYMSPEQAASKKKIGPAADVYGLGAILYECLTGRPPFEGETTVEIVQRVLSDDPLPPRHVNANIPSDLEQICLRCLEKDAAMRPASAAELSRLLTQFLRGEDVLAARLPLTQRLLRWCRARPALAAHLGVLFICAVVVFAKVAVTGIDRFSPIFPWVRLHVVLSIIGVWMLLCAAFQKCLLWQRCAGVVPFVWSGVDVVILSITLLLTNTFVGPLSIGYPLLLAASGLWLRERLVWFNVAAAAVGYLTVLAVLLDAGRVDQLHRHIIFVASLVGLGYIVAYQVRRIQNLSRYYEGRSVH